MISHEFKTIFVHVPKTAGTSIEGMFGLVKTWPGKRKFQEIQGVGKHWGISEMSKEYKDYLNDYFKWTVVRNPWEREFSLFKMMRGQLRYRHLSFKDFLIKVTKHHLQYTGSKFKNMVFRNQVEYLIHNGSLGVDKVIRYEDLHEGWKEVCDIIKKPYEPLMSLRRIRSRLPITAHYDQESIDLVAEMRKEDIEYFNYDYSEAK